MRRGTGRSSRPKRRPLTGRPGLVLALVALAGVLALAGLTARRLQVAAVELKAARDDMNGASSALQDGRIGDARAGLASAQAHITTSNAQLYGNLELDLVGWLPVASQNLASLRESVGIAARLADGGSRILRAAAPLEGAQGKLEVPLKRGAIPLVAVTAAQKEVDALATVLPDRADNESRALILGPVRDLRRTITDAAVSRRRQLDVLGRGLSLLAEMSGANGPRRYLIAVANTAEMRGTGGMILSYGVLDGHDGDFDLTSFGRIDELLLDGPVNPAALNLPADYLERWAGYDVTRLWRNATVAADFTLAAPVLEAMYTKATGLPVDGTIQIDPQGLAAILEGIGPVSVNELGSVDATNVVELSLNKAYALFPGIDRRADVLGDIAEATFNKLFDGEYDSLRPLAESLVRTTAGRHALLHARATRPEADSAYFGADGTLPSPDVLDYASLTVQNISANKIDYYLDSLLGLTGRRQPGEIGTLTATVTLTNTAPAGVREPRYIFGPFDDAQSPGLYRGVVSLYVPNGTSLVAVGGDPTRTKPAATSEDGRSVVSFELEVPPQTTRTVTLELALTPRPAGPYQLDLVPSARVRPTKYHVDIDAGAGVIRADGELDRRAPLAPHTADR